MPGAFWGGWGGEALAYTRKIKGYGLKKAVYLSICILCSAIILYNGFMLYQKISQEDIPDTKDESSTFQSKTIKIARAKLGMKQGELIDADKIEMVEVPAELVPQGAVSSLSRLDNMRLNREVAEKEFLNAAHLIPGEAAYEEGDRLTEHNFAEGAVPAAVSVGSAIDIKLFVKDGKDLVVVSKAIVISRSANLLSFYLNGKEQEYIKEAAAEGILFAVRYVDASQKASEVTYIPLYDKGRDD